MTETPFGDVKPAPNAESVFDAPDHTKSRSVPPGVKKAFGSLGGNKKTRSGVRQLRPEDIQRIREYYDLLAFSMTLYKPAVALAITEVIELPTEEGEEKQTTTRAEMAAEAWGELAKENDGVRRIILMMVETGAWSKVAMVNLPILVAALPDDALSRLMARFMPANPTNGYPFSASEETAA